MGERSKGVTHRWPWHSSSNSTPTQHQLQITFWSPFQQLSMFVLCILYIGEALSLTMTGKNTTVKRFRIWATPRRSRPRLNINPLLYIFPTNNLSNGEKNADISDARESKSGMEIVTLCTACCTKHPESSEQMVWPQHFGGTAFQSRNRWNWGTFATWNRSGAENPVKDWETFVSLPTWCMARL